MHTVETIQLTAATKRPIRRATRVRRSDGREVVFLERMPRGEAIRQAAAIFAREEVSRG